MRIMAALFGVTIVVLVVATCLVDSGPVNPWSVAWFFAFSLFAISCQYQHPGHGFVSFDRVAQFSAVLMLGPLQAAWINALASLVHPIERLRRGESWMHVLAAGFANGSMMGLAVLAGGLVYTAMGGMVPLYHFSLEALAALVGMAVVAHIVNETLLKWVFKMRGFSSQEPYDPYSLTLELLSYLVAALFTVVWMHLPFIEAVVFTGVFCIAIWQLSVHGRMRVRLERIVSERTRDLHVKTEQLHEMTRTDDLTGLRNRRHAQVRLEEEIHRARRHGRPFCLALADLDHFKSINDNYSHAAGDEALRRVAEAFQQEIRGEDMVARFGGEEFIFIFTETGLADAQQVCERLRKAVSRITLNDYSRQLTLSMSVGLAEYAGDAPSELLNRADRALYAAKDAGRDRAQLAQPPRNPLRNFRP